MSRSLHLPKGRSRGNGGLWKLLFVASILSGLTVLAFIWSQRRARGQESQALGTAPAGAPPMPERDPAAPSTRANPLLEPRAPYATPGTTSGAVAGATSGASGETARQPEPSAGVDATGAAAPERLADAGADMAAWVGDLVGDTDRGETPDEAPSASTGSGESDDGEAISRAETASIPTPAAETTGITATEGKDWIQVNGSTTCPPEFPIKGNATSRIYHLPGEPTYEATVPELCFANEEAAVKLGYRARKH